MKPTLQREKYTFYWILTYHRIFKKFMENVFYEKMAGIPFLCAPKEIALSFFHDLLGVPADAYILASKTWLTFREVSFVIENIFEEWKLYGNVKWVLLDYNFLKWNRNLGTCLGLLRSFYTL